MDTPSTRNTGSGGSSVIDSFRGCRLSGVTIPKKELRKKITFPEYLRHAMREAIPAKDASAASVLQLYEKARAKGAEPAEWPVVVFINSNSGGRHGPELKARLQELMSEEQVFDLLAMKPHEFVEYGLSCLENFASHGDNCTKETHEKLRIVVAEGDGTVGWVVGCLEELNKQGRLPILPTGIILLGTANDLSRSFGWPIFPPFIGGPLHWQFYQMQLSVQLACFNVNARWEGTGHALFSEGNRRNTSQSGTGSWREVSRESCLLSTSLL